MTNRERRQASQQPPEHRRSFARLADAAGRDLLSAPATPTSGTVDETPSDTALRKGHRRRLRHRFLASRGTGLADYELIELLLFGAIPRRDVKPLAKRLIQTFGSFEEVLTAEPGRLAAVKGMGEAAVVALKAVEAAARRLAQARVINRPAISNWQALLDYCRIAMGHAPKEQFRVLFLDRRNVLIADEVQQEGTVDHTPVYPREVIKRALELHASAIILVHNHPSGDPTPSQADIEMTKEIAEAARRLGIRLHDHIVVSRSGHMSFKSLGLI
ncbi:MAG: JAB domain-containing protein [Alphaproteobacteria bacterium]|nr:MAG: JAB domain-containing protein [Alphaproteobacteria bacterium]